MTARFDTVIMVDWSSASDRGARPKKDAIWSARAAVGAVGGVVETRYHRSHADIEAWLSDVLEAEIAAGRRTLAGFDFPFGYPCGFAQRLTGGDDPLAVWDWFAQRLPQTDRFSLAGEINTLFPGVGPFWFNGRKADVPDLPRGGNQRHDYDIAEKRAVEMRAKGAFTCWQMGGAGAVGAQAMTGMASLARLRRRLGVSVAVWPFQKLTAPVAFVEVWPSLIADAVREAMAREAAAGAGAIKDEAQVRVLARAVAALAPEALRAMLEVVAPEEGWILGVGHEEALRRAASATSAATDFAASLAPIAATGAPIGAAAPSGAPARTGAPAPIAATGAPTGAPTGALAPSGAPGAVIGVATASAGQTGAPAPTGAGAPPHAPAQTIVPTAAPPMRNDCFALPPGVAWTPVDDALARLRAALSCICEPETVALGEADGRILAADAVALRDHPSSANSAVDGYAFAHVAMGDGALPLSQGRAAAGAGYRGVVPPGAALRILTGAPIPQGCDTVVMQEDATVGGGAIRFEPRLKRGANVRPAGENLRAGAVAAPSRRRLTPADLAQIAAGGLGAVSVRRRLRVAVLSTGDEVTAPGADAGPDAVFDANRPMLLAALRRWGCETVDLGIAPDADAAVRAALDRGAEAADVILTSGGASAGDEDHMSRILREADALTVWRIAMKPGRPLAMGVWRGKPVFGLPGNPVAALVCALIFARPALSVMAGADWPEPRPLMVPAAFAKNKRAGRREFLRARLNAAGAAEVFHSEGSGLIGGLAWAEGLVDLPDAAAAIAPGDKVAFRSYASFGL